MTNTLTLPSPAKLNLFLHINGRLANGYHELQSLFHFLDYGDEMTFTTNNDGEVRLTCNLAELENTDNLVVRAAEKLRPYLVDISPEQTVGIDINLTKKLPMGGGVGGGSSNAATTLLALNELWQLDLSLAKLEHIGNELGADVPIFVRGQSSIAEGTGEKLTRFDINEHWFLVLTPAQHVNTSELFQAPNLPRDTPKLNFNDICYDGLNAEYKNDFQSLVVKKYPVIAKALNWLLEYAPSRMTGTGACVFAEFGTEQQARTVYQKLPKGLTGFVAKGCNVSPTHRALFR